MDGGLGVGIVVVSIVLGIVYVANAATCMSGYRINAPDIKNCTRRAAEQAMQCFICGGRMRRRSTSDLDEERESVVTTLSNTSDVTSTRAGSEDAASRRTSTSKGTLSGSLSSGGSTHSLAL